MPTRTVSMDMYDKDDDSTFYLDVVLCDGKAVYHYGRDKDDQKGELIHNNSLSPLEIMNTILTSLVEKEKKGT